MKTRDFFRVEIGSALVLRRLCACLQGNEIACNFKGGHHAGAFNTAIAAIDSKFDLFIH
nr:hypothetical protein [Polynucleobacter sphagniphilus]